MLCPALGLVIVTDDVAPAATPVMRAVAATRTAAIRQTPVFNVNLLQSLGLARNAEGEGSLLLLVFRDARMVQSVVFQRGPKSNRERGKWAPAFRSRTCARWPLVSWP